MTAIRNDASFPHHYEYSPLRERPGIAAPIYYYPGARTDGGRDGLLIRCCYPDQPAWIGMFAYGGGAFDGVFTCPDERCLCVVAHGAGYIVRVDDPTLWQEVGALPLTDVHPIAAKGLLVLADDLALVAYGRDGVAWRTDRLALDDLRITAITATHIVGTGLRDREAYGSDPEDFDADWMVNLDTGQHEGGLPPLQHP